MNVFYTGIYMREGEESGEMRLSKYAIEELGQMICGEHGNPFHPNSFKWPNFPYRTGPKLYEFFSEYCCLNLIPDFAGTRITWTIQVLTDINNGKVSHSRIPSDKLILHVIKNLLKSVARDDDLDHTRALEDVNTVLAEEGVNVYFVDGEYVFEGAFLQKENESTKTIESFSTISTGGGAGVQGNVHTSGGNFVGRDSIVTQNHYYTRHGHKLTS